MNGTSFCASAIIAVVLISYAIVFVGCVFIIPVIFLDVALFEFVDTEPSPQQRKDVKCYPLAFAAK